MNAIKVTLSLFKETPGSYHYRISLAPGQNGTMWPVSDVYIRKTHLHGEAPPHSVIVEVKQWVHGG